MLQDRWEPPLQFIRPLLSISFSHQATRDLLVVEDNAEAGVFKPHDPGENASIIVKAVSLALTETRSALVKVLSIIVMNRVQGLISS